MTWNFRVHKLRPQGTIYITKPLLKQNSIVPMELTKTGSIIGMSNSVGATLNRKQLAINMFNTYQFFTSKFKSKSVPKDPKTDSQNRSCFLFKILYDSLFTLNPLNIFSFSITKTSTYTLIRKSN